MAERERPTATELFELEEKAGKFLGSQRTFIFGKERFSAIAGGFGSGKSHAGIVKGLVLSSIFPGNAGVIGRYHSTDLEDSTKSLFFEVCPPSWIRSYKGAHAGNIVTLRNGSTIAFRHIHDPKVKLKTKTRVGANLGWFFIDQMEQVSLEHFNAMASRLRRPIRLRPEIEKNLRAKGVDVDRMNKQFGFGALNPNGHDWNWKMFFPQFRDWDADGKFEGRYFQVVRPAPNILGVAVNSNENRKSIGGFVDDDFFDSMLTQYPEEWIQRYILCSFDDFTGKIYKGYQAGIETPETASVHNIEPFDLSARQFKHWEVVVGIDVGGESPWAIVPNYIDDWGNCIVPTALVKSRLTSAEVAAWIKTHLPWNESRCRFVIDPENKLAMLELAEYGIHCQAAIKGAGSVRSGILRTAGYFHVRRGVPLPPWYLDTQPSQLINKFSKLGSPRTFVFKVPATLLYRKDHDEYVWNPDKPDEPLKTKERRFDACDADRYVKMFAPLPAERRPAPPDYTEMRQRDPLSAREWEQLDKRIAARIDAQRYGSLREADTDEVEPASPRIARSYEW